MAAVVGDDEDPHHEAGGQDDDGQCQPVGDGEQAVGDVPEGQVGADAVDQLPDAAFDVRALVSGDDLLPALLHFVHDTCRRAKV